MYSQNEVLVQGSPAVTFDSPSVHGDKAALILRPSTRLGVLDALMPLSPEINTK